MYYEEMEMCVEDVFDFVVDMYFKCKNLMYFYQIPEKAVMAEVRNQVKEGRVLLNYEMMRGA